MRHAHSITLTISTENAAFDDHETGEVCRLLRDCARRIDAGHGALLSELDSPIQDSNGNTVGYLVIEKQI